MAESPTSSAIVRVGIGTDLHRLVPDRRLVLAHVEVPCELGLAGHSDADVVLHAVIDALLGAAGLGDIGELFPDTDPAYKDGDSGELLRTVLEKVHAAGYAPGNLDATIHAERPKLSPYKAAMRDELARLTGLPANAVNIKAKTNETVDAVGRGEAIACTAVIGLTTIRA